MAPRRPLLIIHQGNRRNMKDEYNRKQKLTVILLDIIILFELAVSLYWSNQFGDEVTKMFLASYIPIALVTLIIGKVCINKLDTKNEDGSVTIN